MLRTNNAAAAAFGAGEESCTAVMFVLKTGRVKVTRRDPTASEKGSPQRSGTWVLDQFRCQPRWTICSNFAFELTILRQLPPITLAMSTVDRQPSNNPQ
jgi:hypothetical protein